MQGGGFTVSTEVLTPRENWSFYQEKASPTPNPEKIVRMKFSDTGVGIRKEDMEKILEPFLNNLTLNDNEKNYIVENTLAKVQIIDPARGNDFFCEGKIATELE